MAIPWDLIIVVGIGYYLYTTGTLDSIIQNVMAAVPAPAAAAPQQPAAAAAPQQPGNSPSLIADCNKFPNDFRCVAQQPAAAAPKQAAAKAAPKANTRAAKTPVKNHVQAAAAPAAAGAGGQFTTGSGQQLKSTVNNAALIAMGVSSAGCPSGGVRSGGRNCYTLPGRHHCCPGKPSPAGSPSNAAGQTPCECDV